MLIIYWYETGMGGGGNTQPRGAGELAMRGAREHLRATAPLPRRGRERSRPARRTPNTPCSSRVGDKSLERPIKAYPHSDSTNTDPPLLTARVGTAGQPCRGRRVQRTRGFPVQFQLIILGDWAIVSYRITYRIVILPAIGTG